MKTLQNATAEVERHPADARAQMQLAQLYAGAGRLDEAEARAEIAVGPDLCDNAGDPGTQQAFNQFHNNLHIATASSIGPAAPGLHNGHGGELVARGCSFVPPS